MTGPNPPTRVHGLVALAENCISQSRHEEAERLLQRALALPELGEEHNQHRVAQVRQLYGALLKLTGRIAEALELEARARPPRHGPLDQLPDVRRQVVMPPPAPEEQPEFVWISALIVGYVREASAAIRFQTTGDTATWYRQYRSGGSSGGGGGGGLGQRDHSFRLDLRSPSSPVDFEVFALSAGQADVVTTCFDPAIAPAPGTSRVGAPRIVVESRVRLLGRPSFAEAEVRLANAGDGDALRVRLDPPTLADGWEPLSQRVAGEPLPDPLEVGRIGAGGTGILLLRLCRREGDALPAVTIHGRYTDEGGTPLAF